MRVELDSHADTCAFGHCCLVLKETGKTISVEGFNKKMGSIPDVKICTVAVAYDCPTTGKTYLLLFHEALYIPALTVHLLNPTQMRMQGIEVNDVPLMSLPEEERTQLKHSIVSHDPPLHIPMDLEGVMSGFTLRKPTWDEVRDFDEHNVMRVHMTSHEPWEPYSEDFAQIEGTLREELTRGYDLATLEGVTRYQSTPTEGTRRTL